MAIIVGLCRRASKSQLWMSSWSHFLLPSKWCQRRQSILFGRIRNLWQCDTGGVWTWNFSNFLMGIKVRHCQWCPTVIHNFSPSHKSIPLSVSYWKSLLSLCSFLLVYMKNVIGKSRWKAVNGHWLQTQSSVQAWLKFRPKNESEKNLSLKYLLI